jgi:hypothetical protein
MPAFLLGWFRLICLFTRGHQALVLENLALRQQLAVYKRQSKRPRLKRSDRVFWIVLASAWKGWRRVLLLVHPDTVVRWQRLRFRRYWAQLSCKPKGKVGRPPIGKPVRNLIRNMAGANPLWRAPRIHGELLKLGIKVFGTHGFSHIANGATASVANLENVSTEPHRRDRRDGFLYCA